MSSMKELALTAISDLVKDLFHYDRKEDEDLPEGAIEELIERGELEIEELVDRFREEIEELFEDEPEDDSR